MDERVGERGEVTTPLAGEAQSVSHSVSCGVAPAAQVPVVVEFEESPVRSEPEPAPASWPLHLLTWLFAAGIVGGVLGLVFLALFDVPANLPEGVTYEELKPKMYLRAVLALGTSATAWWLLSKRRRAGAILAALVFALPQIPTLVVGQFHWSSLAFSAAVIACAAASWRELE
ncbi:MAG: hypothetical protein C0516_12830 [Gemmatimonas sp.]|nr:hypothetical protein [Gemmatimonas sp.]